MYLLSKNGLKLLESLCFTNTLFAFDFDGTLSKIVTDPELATIGKLTAELLAELNDLAPVAVISGRSLRDLMSKIKNPVKFMVGNHGLEGIHPENLSTDTFRKTCALWRAQLEGNFKKNIPIGVEIEDKDFSLAIHYRKSRQKKLARNLILESIGHIQPSARVIMGKCVVNLIPSGGPHKGVALLELMIKSDTKSAFYVGDDDTDEDIFSLSDPRVFTVRVGKKKSTQAKFFLQRQSQINLLLKVLISFLDKSSKGREYKVGLHRNI